MPERRHCILWIRPRMAKYFQAEMKTVYLLGRDRLSRTINSQTVAYKQSSIVLQNTVYVNENKIMRRNTKKMSRFIVYVVVNPSFAAVTLKFLPVSVYLFLRERLKNTPEKQPHQPIKEYQRVSYKTLRSCFDFIR